MKAGPALRAVRRAAVISDLHLSPGDDAAIDSFIEFINTLAGVVDELFILGDLFEAYVGAKHLRMGRYPEVVSALLGLERNGIRVTALKGNRDFLLDGQFTKKTGVRVAGDEDAIVSGGKKILFVHGDLFCIRDVRYQAMRRKLRSPVLRVASRALPLSISLKIAAKLRKTSVDEIRMKTPAEMGIVTSEVEARLAEGYDTVVCGHVHDPRVESLRNGTLVVLPAWPAAPGTCWIREGTILFV
ncbi:MAG: UDP-2,3-diacylglucosamine diphosphatase [Planctomycetes bacterium]|nr:UDP-2,3-diacylglucosamine diphosphatase [Planctomycetota bacterium]